MATGIPKKSSTGQSAVSMELAYEGKMERAAVLRHTPVELVRMWRHPSASGKCLYYGDNLDVLAALARDKTVCGQIKLIYIDPPFATEGVFVSRKQEHAYHDVLVGAEYVESLRQRLILLHHLLAEDGSIYLHIDEKMVFHLKLVLDEVFGAGNYRNCITRKKCNPKNYTRKTFGNVADYILFYTKSDDYVWNRQYEAWTEERAKEYQYIDEKTGRRFMKVPIHAPGTRNGDTGKPWRGLVPPPGKHWQYAPSTLDEMDAKGEIFWSSSGNPRRKVFLDDRPGVGVQDIWLDSGTPIIRIFRSQDIRLKRMRIYCAELFAPRPIRVTLCLIAIVDLEQLWRSQTNSSESGSASIVVPKQSKRFLTGLCTERNLWALSFLTRTARQAMIGKWDCLIR